MFENNDEFGLQEYREDITYVMNANSIVVKQIKFNEKKGKNIQNDYFGIKTKTFEDVPKLIRINIMSTSPNKSKENKEGYNGHGEVTYTCFAPYYVDIGNKDIIEFVKDFNYSIKAGSRFRVEMDDEGLYRGQYSYKQFTLTLIDNVEVEQRSPESFDGILTENEGFVTSEDGGIFEFK